MNDVRELYDTEDVIAKELFNCKSLEEVHRKATIFNHWYAIAVKHFTRMEEIRDGKF